MWPWEHLAFGYLIYSLAAHTWEERPTNAAALALAFSTQFPDLVDKPLAWGLHVLPAGRSLAHSLLVAVPLVTVVGAVCWRLDRTDVAVAVAIGYFSHLAGDVIYPLMTRGEAPLNFLFYPLLPVGGGTGSALPHLLELVGDFLTFLASARGTVYLLFDVLLVATAFLVWVADGVPGLALFLPAENR